MNRHVISRRGCAGSGPAGVEALEGRRLLSAAAQAPAEFVLRGGHFPAGVLARPVAGTVVTVHGANLPADSGDYSLNIDWGDGTTTSGAPMDVAGAGATRRLTAAHTYTKAGVFHIRVDAQLGVGTNTTPLGTATATARIRLRRTTPNARLVRTDAGAAQALALGSVGALPRAGEALLIDWGDGTALSSPGINRTGDGYALSGTHVYSDPGKYTITVSRVAIETGQAKSVLIGAAVVAGHAQTPSAGPVVTPNMLDTTFGNQGIVTIPSLGSTGTHSLLTQPDGKVLVAAGDRKPDGPLQVFRYNPDGSLDASFGVAGEADVMVVEPVVSGTFGAPLENGPYYLGAAETMLQDDGRIVVAATEYSGSGMMERDDVVVVRLNPDGTLDASFGQNGEAVQQAGGRVEGMTIRPDGRLLVATDLVKPSELVEIPDGLYVPSYALSLRRYNTDGSLDPSFGTGGIVTVDEHEALGAAAVAVRPDGRIVLAAIEAAPQSGVELTLMGFTPAGAIDTSFGQSGSVQTGIATEDADLVLQSNGDIVVTATDWQVSGSGTKQTYLQRAVLARYNPDGSPDESFGVAGKVFTDPPTGGGGRSATQLALLPDGKILQAGWVNITPQGPWGVELRQFLAKGQADPSFGQDGVAQVFTSRATGIADDGSSLPPSQFASLALDPAGGPLLLVGGDANGWLIRLRSVRA